MENNLIIVTNWDKVEKDDFYLTDKWAIEQGEESVQGARELQGEGHLYEAYIVDAKNYAIYRQMDADKVFVDEDCNIILHCESAIINSDHTHREEYNY